VFWSVLSLNAFGRPRGFCAMILPPAACEKAQLIDPK
jgi:hypothetical protein